MFLAKCVTCFVVFKKIQAKPWASKLKNTTCKVLISKIFHGANLMLNSGVSKKSLKLCNSFFWIIINSCRAYQEGNSWNGQWKQNKIYPIAPGLILKWILMKHCSYNSDGPLRWFVNRQHDSIRILANTVFSSWIITISLGIVSNSWFFEWCPLP